MVIPTFNEIENLAEVVARVRRSMPDVDVLGQCVKEALDELIKDWTKVFQEEGKI